MKHLFLAAALLLGLIGQAEAANTSNCSQSTSTVLLDLGCNTFTAPKVPNHYSAQISTSTTSTVTGTLWQPASSLASTTTSGTINAGTNVLTVTSAAGIARGQTVFSGTGGTLTNFNSGCVVINVSGTNITTNCLTTGTISTGTSILFYSTSGWNGTKFTGASCTNSDTTNAYTLTLQYTEGGSTYPMETVSIPAGAGTVAGTPPVDLFNAVVGNSLNLPLDTAGNRYFVLIPGDVLQIAVAAGAANSKTIACQTTAASDY